MNICVKQPPPPPPTKTISHQCSFKNRDYSHTKSRSRENPATESSRVHHVSRTQCQQSPSNQDTQLPALKRKPWLAPQYSTAAAEKPSSRCLRGLIPIIFVSVGRRASAAPSTSGAIYPEVPGYQITTHPTTTTIPHCGSCFEEGLHPGPCCL